LPICHKFSLCATFASHSGQEEVADAAAESTCCCGQYRNESCLTKIGWTILAIYTTETTRYFDLKFGKKKIGIEIIFLTLDLAPDDILK